MGCPAPQIKRQGCGAALLDHPERCEELVRSIKSASDKPLLVKIRAGNGVKIDVVSFARRLVAAGADAFIFHARTAAQGYSGRADWGLIRELKRAVDVPIIGNGDIRSGPDAEQALTMSGADGIALGRATLGDPRIFGRIAHFLQHGVEPAPPTPQERASDFLEYYVMAGGLGFTNTRIVQQAQRFTNGIEGGWDLRSNLRGRVGLDVVRRAFERLRETGDAFDAARVLPGPWPSPVALSH
jgi:tRNA-dihydrouridine synthase